jgi:hypothetical protein
LDNPSRVYFLLAAVADFTAVVVHGIVGHRALMSPLTRDRLFPTRAFGDEDMSWRILVVAWHFVTAVFACSGVALLLLALNLLHGTSLPLFLAGTHVAFLLVALSIVGRRFLSAFRRPIPIAFAICMMTVCVAAWLGTR